MRNAVNTTKSQVTHTVSYYLENLQNKNFGIAGKCLPVTQVNVIYH